MDGASVSMLFRNLQGKAVDGWCFSVDAVQEPALFQVEAIHLTSTSNHVEVCTRRVVGNVSPENWDSQSVVAASLRVKFNVSVTVHEHNLGIVLTEHAEFCHLAIETALKLHSQIMEVVAS